MSVATATSPFYYSSPNSLSLLLEHRGNQCVPGTPPLETFRGASSLQRTFNEARVSPMGQLVPEAVNVHRSGGQGPSNTAYTGSPLLRQILRYGRKRQCEDGDQTTPSPSNKRHCHDNDDYRVPTSLVVLKRSATPTKHSDRDKKQLQVVPENSHLQAKKPSPNATQRQRSCKTSSTTRKTTSEDDSGFKWFDFFIGENDKLTQAEE